MNSVCIGIHVHEQPERLLASFGSLRANTSSDVDVVLLPDGPDDPTRMALASFGDVPQLGTDSPQGAAACFNRLAASSCAEVLVLLESGCVVGYGWLDRLLVALSADTRNGLAGPSTNSCWNEQCVLRYGLAHPTTATGSHTLADVDRLSDVVQRHFGASTRTLEPLYSLADFCYVVRREVIDVVGAADEGYGTGPCWEMDYNIRAARAGFRGVWACSAYVHRSPFTTRRALDETRYFAPSKRRYQDQFCALRLSGQRDDYEPHCRGSECEHFAPASLIRIHRPLPTVLPAVASPAISTRCEDLPMVSCIMATRDRRDFVLQSVRYFQRQDYAARELIILDDGSQNLSSEIDDERVRYLHLPPGVSIGVKRNKGCELARGTIVAHWDDDDWYAPNRLSLQAAPLIEGNADVSGLAASVFFDLDRWQFWQCTPALHRRMFVGDVHGGTLMFRRSLFEAGLRYPDRSLAEDAWFLHSATQRGARLHRQPADGCFVYVRHGQSSWKFDCGEFIDPQGWQRVQEPAFSPEDRAFYGARSTLHRPTSGNGSRRPFVTCIMPTADRRPFVPKAIEYFLRQDYPERELLILDDGRDQVADVVPADSRIRYVRLQGTRSLGAKRNLACDLAAGDIIVHWDDDDWMADRRLSYQVEALLQSPEKEICGLARVLFYDPCQQQAWEYIHPPGARAWVSGNTLCYRKTLTRRQRFPDISEGEDTLFVWSLRDDQMLRLPDSTFYVATVHAGNTSRKRPHHPGWHPIPPPEIGRLLNQDLSFYEGWAADATHKPRRSAC